MKIFKGIGFFLLVIIILYVILGVFGPSDYKVERSIKIEATPDVVFDQTSKFANWGSWSHWSQMDPNAVYTIENDNQEPGAIMTWEGDITGKGIMTSTEVVKNEKFGYTLEFIEPWYMAGSSIGGFSYKNEGDSVLLTWTDEAPIAFMYRPFMLFMSVEDQIGPAFEKSLIGIKTICEDMKKTLAMEITEEMVEAKPILFISESSSLMPSEIGAKMGAAFGEIMALMGIAKIEMVSPPRSITTLFSIEEMKCEFDAAIVAQIPEGMELSGRIEKGQTYAGKALKTVHVGSYANLKTTYDGIIAYINDNGYEINGNSWEEYIDDPMQVAKEKIRTIIYFPVK